MQEHIDSITNKSFSKNFSNLYFKEEKSLNKIVNNKAESSTQYAESRKIETIDSLNEKVLIINFNDKESELIEQSVKQLNNLKNSFDFLVSGSSETAYRTLKNTKNIALVFIKGDINGTEIKQTVTYIRNELNNDLIQIILMNAGKSEDLDVNFLINNKINYCLSNSDLSNQKLKIVFASTLRAYRTQKENEEYNSDISEVIDKRTKDLSKKNEELLKADATKNKMFSIIAHDLVNPFNSILGFSKMLKDQISDFNKERIELFADQIYETSQNTYKLLANLLEWSRAQTGKIKYSPREIQINKLIKNNIVLHKNLAEKKGLYLKYFGKENISVYCDPNMISTVIRNLISNGIKFTEKGGVTISVETDEEFCTICFTDTGYGIQQDRIENIFTFENLSTKGTSGERGSGLGLLLCNEFALRNKGSITVKSKVNSGSTFCVKIPLSSKIQN